MKARSLKVTAVLLLGLTAGLVAIRLNENTLQGQVSGIDLGMCEQVQPDPDTGERVVYCCLDELYVFYTEGLEDEMNAFLSHLETVEGKTPAEARAIFEGEYQSTLHERYGWDSFCGEPLACELCALGPLCGNNVVQEGEECDDGNRESGDGCSATCTVEEVAQVVCGNGLMEDQEECDDGNNTNGDGCNAACRIEQQDADIPVPGTMPSLQSSSQEAKESSSSAAGTTGPNEPSFTALCGNGLVETGEQCDQGAGNSWVPGACRPDCLLPVCGDTIRDPSEQCDDGNNVDGDGCTALCALEATRPAAPEAVDTQSSCGNGIIEEGEACDAFEGSAFCDANCQVRTEARARAVCGDGILHPEEQCDDGNSQSGDGCGALCMVEPGTSLWCGDGVLTADEQCDDGNTVSSDGCSRFCRLENAVAIGTALCGNATVDPGEECDDGNNVDEDGCSATCFLESGTLGDGIVQRALGERCEQSTHSTEAAYGCMRNGRFELRFCGNGILNPGEECDLGRTNSDSPNALCRLDCSRAGCGDGIVDTGEQCDDGNLVSGDDCNRFCEWESPQVAAQQQTSSVQATQAPVEPQVITSTDTSSVSWETHNAAQAALLAQQEQGKGPIGATGPAAVGIMAVGAAAGYLFRRKKS